MKKLKGKVAAVTGAASGIGRMLAVNLAKEGCNLAICDINKKGLEETARMIGGGVKVTTHVVDVSDRKQVYRYADDVVKKHGGVDIIINNAGVTVAETLEDMKYEDFEWVFSINFWGVVYGTKAFLPYLKKRPEGHIVNISSINAVVVFSNNGPYNATKWAVAGFTETLIQELDGSSVRFSCVHPGGIKTNIARNARFYKYTNPETTREDMVKIADRLFVTSPDRAARVIISGIKRNKRRILVGFDAHLLDIQKRIFPVLTNIVTGKVMKLLK